MRSGVSLQRRLQAIASYWQPVVVAEYNGNDLMVVKVKGEFNWHSHAETDDFFLVLKGRLQIDLEGGESVSLGAGELFVVPRGMQHRPRAEEETHILLIEPAGTPNTGDRKTAAPRIRHHDVGGS